MQNQEDINEEIRELVKKNVESNYEELMAYIQNRVYRYSRHAEKRDDFIQQALKRILEECPKSLEEMKKIADKGLHNAYRRDLGLRKKVFSVSDFNFVHNEAKDFLLK